MDDRTGHTARLRLGMAVVGGLALMAAACGSSSSSSSASSAASANSLGTGTCGSQGGTGPWGWTGTAATGFQPSHEPDVNCDGKVVIGILSPGDTNDHGYYESFVDTAKLFATKNGWQVITINKINPADAVNQARNLCRQHVDMVAVAASELKDAIPVSQEAVCQNTVWYVAGGQGVVQTPYFVQSQDDVNESLYAAGYASGLIMQANGSTKAGFITGPELDFAKQAAKAYTKGIQNVIPTATVLTAYTGSFDDSGLAVTAANAQIAQGVGIIYPYLGGATDAVAALGDQHNIPELTPGTNRCGGGTPAYAVSVVFSPGDYFAAALAPFAKGTLTIGTAHVWHMGKDPVPTVIICSPTGTQKQMVDALIQQIGSGAVKPDQIVNGS